jgi:hypothetical protein
MRAPTAPAADASRSSLSCFDPVLSDLRANAGKHFGAPEVRLLPRESQDRPFSRLLRLAVHRDRDLKPAAHIFVKVSKHKVLNGDPDAMRRRVVHDFDVTSRVYAAMRDEPELGAVRPIACYPEHLAIVTEQADGVTLLEHLERQRTWLPGGADLQALRRTMATVGRWIRVFQSSALATAPTGVEDLRAYLDHRVRQLVRVDRHFTEPLRGRILKHVDILGSGIADSEMQAVPVHSDLSLGNILVDGARVVVLDFAMTRSGTRLHDLTRVAFQLDLLAMKPYMRRRAIASLQRALVQGFDPGVSSDGALFRLHLLLHRVNHLLTLTASRASFGSRAYNALVKRRHREWIARELRAGAGR